jgi:hypothetical protein
MLYEKLLYAFVPRCLLAEELAVETVWRPSPAPASEDEGGENGAVRPTADLARFAWDCFTDTKDAARPAPPEKLDGIGGWQDRHHHPCPPWLYEQPAPSAGRPDGKDMLMLLMNEPMPPLPLKAGDEADDLVGGIDSYQRSVCVNAVR